MKFKNLQKLLPLAVSASLVFLFFYPLLLSDKVFFLRDFHRWFYPMKFYLASCFREGSLPYWCPYYFCGAPFLSDIQSGVFYPLSVIPALFSYPKALNLYILLHFFLGFLFFYYFLRSQGLSIKASLVVSISYSYGSYSIASISTLNNLSTMIWLPALLWAFQRTESRGYPLGYFWAVFCLCMLFLGGEPQLAIMVIVLLVFNPLFFTESKRLSIRSWVRSSMTIFFLVLSAILITMVQLGPTFQDYQLSVRTGGFQFSEATQFSLSPAMLKHLFLPLVFPAHYESDPLVLNGLFPGTGSMPWLLTIYPGMMILPLALFGLVFRFSSRILFWSLLFILCLLLSLGHQTPLYSLFYKALPVFRFPEKFMFLASFALQVMAAFGFERLLRIFGTRRWKQNLIFCLALFTLAADLFYSHRHLNPVFDAGLYAAYDRNLEPILKDPESFRVYVDPEINNSGGPSILNRHQQWQNYLMPNLGILHHVSHADGVTGLELKYQYILTELLMKPWPERVRLLKLLNVKYIVSPLQLERNSELVDQVVRINRFVYELKGHLPRAWIVGNLAQIGEGIAEELIDPSFDPLHTALAREPISEKPLEPFHQPVHSVHYTMDGRIHIEVTARQHGFLVLSESSYPGWQVILDGAEQDPLWLNLLFQGVEIEPGKHQIDFIFRPKGFAVFALVSAVSLFLFLVGVVVAISLTKSRGCSVKG